ncbi:hypothetical protein RFI_22032 [Reticulomyxa filosa]|uniref:Uncharacterized protein n=1 Tax=Reticulomyxa filosa TaxID=46433 RepID=X6MMW0_RETFI|nr:hypothetical protein RFI_22032 [Reticulomyxa filosa]|eukprot:ETO15333.1 hypothetical protein RFI_22032 [Reticulomyxa filosa]
MQKSVDLTAEMDAEIEANRLGKTTAEPPGLHNKELDESKSNPFMEGPSPTMSLNSISKLHTTPIVPNENACDHNGTMTTMNNLKDKIHIDIPDNARGNDGMSWYRGQSEQATDTPPVAPNPPTLQLITGAATISTTAPTTASSTTNTTTNSTPTLNQLEEPIANKDIHFHFIPLHPNSSLSHAMQNNNVAIDSTLITILPDTPSEDIQREEKKEDNHPNHSNPAQPGPDIDTLVRRNSDSKSLSKLKYSEAMDDANKEYYQHNNTDFIVSATPNAPEKPHHAKNAHRDLLLTSAERVEDDDLENHSHHHIISAATSVAEATMLSKNSAYKKKKNHNFLSSKNSHVRLDAAEQHTTVCNWSFLCGLFKLKRTKTKNR